MAIFVKGRAFGVSLSSIRFTFFAVAALAISPGKLDVSLRNWPEHLGASKCRLLQSDGRGWIWSSTPEEVPRAGVSEESPAASRQPQGSVFLHLA